MRILYTARLTGELEALEAYLAAEASPLTAARYIARLLDALDGLALMPERYPARPELGPDIRLFVFERRITVLFRIEADLVSLVALYGPGRRLEPVGGGG